MKKSFIVTNLDSLPPISSEMSFTSEDQISFKNALKGESDRGAVLMTASILDEILKCQIKRKCVIDSEKSINGLFDAGGPFDSFSSKIEWLYCSGELKKTLRDDLHVIRKMRNESAHLWRTFSLDDRIESAYLQKMHLYSDVTFVKKNLSLENPKLQNVDIKIECRAQFIFLATSLVGFVNTGNAPHTHSKWHEP